jgi:tRNA pseudouridine55 synthase
MSDVAPVKEKKPPRIKHEKFEINGWIALDKPLNMTSTQAVAFVKRLFKAKKCGHAGTLDPLATGVLPIALGEATKTVPYVMEDGMKAYRFTVTWGVETTTDDAEGTAVKTSNLRPSKADVEALLPKYIGTIMQTPPQFSAIKINGERAYDLARAGEVVDIAPREAEVYSLIVVSHDENTSVLEATCGKGTYVRSFARDLGRDLGCFGHVTSLRRLAVGSIREEHCIAPIALEALDEMGLLSNALHPVQLGLTELDEIILNLDQAARLRRGQNVLLRGLQAPAEGHYWASCEGNLVAICDFLEGTLEPKRVFSY